MSKTTENAQTSTEPVADTKTISRGRLLKAGGAALAAGMSLPLLDASASPAVAATKRTMKATKKTQLTLMSWEPFQPTEKAAWFQVTKNFMAANPSIQVKWTGWPFANFDQNVITQAQAGHVDADVVQCPPELASTLITNYNLCEPIGSIASSLGLIPNPSHNQFKVHGQLYALGVLEVAFVLTYDKRILKQAGYSGPPTTLAQWLSMTKALTKPPKQYGMFLINNAAAAADWWNQLQNFTLAYGGVWAKGKTLMINSPQNVKAMQFWLDLLNASGLKGSAEPAITKLYQNDQVAMDLQVGFGSSVLKATEPKLYPNLRSAAPPWPGKKAISRLHPMVVLKTSKNVDAAMELVKWCIEPKNLWYVTKQNGYPRIPYANFAEKVPQYTAFENSLAWVTGFRQTNYVGEADILGEYTFAYAQIGNIICNNIEKAVSGSSTVKAALDAAQAQAQESLHL